MIDAARERALWQTRRGSGRGLARVAKLASLSDDARSFLPAERIERILSGAQDPTPRRLRGILAKAQGLERLEPIEAAALLHCNDDRLWNEIYATAAEVKERVYGRRIVLFAPLYVSSRCVNDCAYCGYRRSNEHLERAHLTAEDVRDEVRALVDMGHKRVLLVFGEHPTSTIDYIEDIVAATYDVRASRGEIRRVNINGPPMALEDLRRLQRVGIGTYQVFQETYHRPTYERLHPADTIKGHFLWRLYAHHRAQRAGIDDIAIGALLGLYDYRFEAVAMLLHALELERQFGGVGPHTISFPRIRPAVNTPTRWPHAVTDEQLKQLIAVMRLAVPYTGLILTAREPATLRRELLGVGITQIDAGSNISIGGYGGQRTADQRQQFLLQDDRTLDETVEELVSLGLIPSFCTAGYRCGRTGATFMRLAKAGDVHRWCLPNALITLQEYVEDHATPRTRRQGARLIRDELHRLRGGELRSTVAELLERTRAGERDLYL